MLTPTEDKALKVFKKLSLKAQEAYLRDTYLGVREGFEPLMLHYIMARVLINKLWYGIKGRVEDKRDPFEGGPP